MNNTDNGLESGAKPFYYPVRETDHNIGESRLHKIQDTLNVQPDFNLIEPH